MSARIKLAVLLTLLCQLALKAQTNHLSKRISLEVTDIPVGIAMEGIEVKGDFYFSYNSGLINTERRIDLNISNQTVKRTLDDMFFKRLQYRSIGQHLILYEKNLRGSRTVLSGYITDASTGRGLHQATVYDLQRNRVAITDQGRFSMEVVSGSGPVTLNVSKAGYRDQLMYIKPEQAVEVSTQLFPWEEGIEGLTAKVPDTTLNNLQSRRLVRWIVPSTAIVVSRNLDLYEERDYQVSFLPFLGTNGKLSGRVKNKFSLNILGGYSAGLEGIELGGFGNVNRKSAKGIQIAGFGNVNGEHTYGIQVAGLSNYSGGRTGGLQVAGFSNLTLGNMNGVQLAGFVNVLRGEFRGLQLSGFTNVNTGDVDGMQLTGFVNIGLKDVNLMQVSGFYNQAINVEGAQITGFANLVTGDVNAFQIAGFSNMATNVNYMQVAGFLNVSLENNNGIQIAGFMNYAHFIEGLQVSVINYADSIGSGIPIGLLSIVNKGLHRLEFSANEIFPFNVGFKTGVPEFYNIVRTGFNGNWLHATYGVGTEFYTWLHSLISIELEYSALISRNMNDLMGGMVRLTPAYKFPFGKYYAVSIGPTIAMGAVDNPEEGETPALSSAPIIDRQQPANRLQMWIGGYLSLELF